MCFAGIIELFFVSTKGGTMEEKVVVCKDGITNKINQCAETCICTWVEIIM